MASGPPVDPTSYQTGDQRANPEEEAGRAEADIERHDWAPREETTVREERTTSSSAPARIGNPWRPSQRLLSPANRSAILVRITGMVVRVIRTKIADRFAGLS